MNLIEKALLILTAFLTLALGGCETTRITVEDLKVKAPVGQTLPIKAKVLLVMEPWVRKKIYRVNYGNYIYQLPDGELLHRSAMSVFQHVFSDIKSSPMDQGNLVLHVSSQAHVDTFSFSGIHSVKATAHIKKPDGTIIGKFDGQGIVMSSKVADAIALENAYIKAFRDIISQVLKNQGFLDLAKRGFGEPVHIVTGYELKPDTNVKTSITKSGNNPNVIDQALAIARRGNIVSASKVLYEAANQNDPLAQTAIALNYKGDNGGLVPSTKKALYWLGKAAEQGFPEAQYQLGHMYSYGEGVKENKALAAEWYRKAAVQGHAVAQNHLGSLYINGEGISKDYAMAKTWYTKSAYQGFVYGQYNLGAMYSGRYDGVPKDYVRIFVWSKLAADQGYAVAKQNQKNSLDQMTGNQLSEAAALIKTISANIRRSEVTLLHDDIIHLASDQFPDSVSVSHEWFNFNGFTAKAPAEWQGAHMAVVDANKVNTNEYSVATFKSDGSCKQCSGGAFVNVASLEDQRFTSSRELLEFLRRSESGNMVFGLKFIQLYNLNFNYWEEDKEDKICVSFEMYNKPPFSITKTYFSLFGHGFVCVHPHMPSLVVTASVHQKSTKELTSDQKQKLIKLAENFLKDIKFTPTN